MDVGNYQTIEKIGEGAFSDVLKARDKTTGKLVAMKRFKKRLHNVSEIDLLREIQALRRVHHHPNVVRLEEVIFDAKNGILTLAFELMDFNLYDILSKKGAPPLHEQKVRWVMWQTMKALDFIHSKGIFHRDMKPENVLVKGMNLHDMPIPFPDPSTKLTNAPVVKLSDFGSCRGVHSRMPYTEYIGTRWYRSPECLLFDGIYTLKLDIWGAGCILFELLTKMPLFAGDDEVDQLSKIHRVLGTPSENMLTAMISSGKDAMVKSNAGRNPKKMPESIYTGEITFPAQKANGIKSAFPTHILLGVSRLKMATGNQGKHFSAKDYPGLSNECVQFLEYTIRYDPAERLSAKELIKHAWFRAFQDPYTAAEEQQNLIAKTATISLTKKDAIHSNTQLSITARDFSHMSLSPETVFKPDTQPKNVPAPPPILPEERLPKTVEVQLKQEEQGYVTAKPSNNQPKVFLPRQTPAGHLPSLAVVRQKRASNGGRSSPGLPSSASPKTQAVHQAVKALGPKT